MEPHFDKEAETGPQVIAPNPVLASPGSIPRITIDAMHPYSFSHNAG